MSAPANLSERVREWRDRGHAEEFRGRRIHCFHQPGEGPLLLLLHGFPTCSYDWRDLIALEPGRAILAFDFLGFGLSEKPRDHEYTLAWQADLSEELVRRHGGGPVHLVAHDMGTSVATELLARVSSGRFFRWQLGSVFADAHPMGAKEGADQWALMKLDGGNRIAHKLIGYTFERAHHAERWHGAVRDWAGPLALVWGLQDPVATTRVLDGLRELRPNAPVFELPSLAHYPQIEDPTAFHAALSSALEAR